jgi:hypothetical protein
MPRDTRGVPIAAPPYAFTEHGVAMLAAVLRSDRAVQVSISIVRAFVKLRELLELKSLPGPKTQRIN